MSRIKILRQYAGEVRGGQNMETLYIILGLQTFIQQAVGKPLSGFMQKANMVRHTFYIGNSSFKRPIRELYNGQDKN